MDHWTTPPVAQNAPAEVGNREGIKYRNRTGQQARRGLLPASSVLPNPLITDSNHPDPFLSPRPTVLTIPPAIIQIDYTPHVLREKKQCQILNLERIYHVYATH